jgi:hypothetical protein
MLCKKIHHKPKIDTVYRVRTETRGNLDKLTDDKNRETL